MCGIAGIFDRSATTPSERLEADVRAMATAEAQRGPDDAGTWVDAPAGIGLGHRRLAIIDCDPSGHQPMASASGRFVISYNGEIYNYLALKADLEREGQAIEGGSDTAVLLAACARWGVAETLRRTVGMFAFALWDRETRTLTFARDRLGIKPLYWTLLGDKVLFASQLGPLRAGGGWDEEIDRASLASFLRLGYVPTPHTIFKGVHKLAPASVATIAAAGEPTVERYWDVRAAAQDGARAPFAGSYDDAVDALEQLIAGAVADRLMSDVPLGAFLSGGIDSSTVAAFMQKASARPVRTFSIGFREAAYDESHHAAAVAAHLGTEHTELTATPADALELVPRIPEWYDEPFADSSQIPTLLLSRLTRRHVTVALSGDGGDEVFAGYNRYFWAERIWGAVGRTPRAVRQGIAKVLTTVPPGAWDGLARAVPAERRPVQTGDKVHKAAGILDAADMDAVYRRLVSQWPPDEARTLVPGAAEHVGPLDDPGLQADCPEPLARMRLLDMMTYLPDDILAKVDRASMAFALEARVPLLDHRIVEFAWSLPRDFLVANGGGKRILRDVLDRHVPRHLIDRPKMGFGVPIADWLRGPLKDWAAALLDPARLKREGYIDPAPVARAWREHQSGTRNRQYALWTVLMFQAWLDHGRPAGRATGA